MVAGGLLVVVVLGGWATGFGAEVVVTGGAEFVVTGEAECVVTAGAECVVTGGGVVAVCVVVVVALWVVVVWLWTAGVLVVVVVVDVVDVVAGVEAAALVELVLEDEPLPPHPAIATAAKIVLSSAFFIRTAPVLARKVRRSDYKTPPAPKRFGSA